MQKQQVIKCAFCKGTGKNPYYLGTCPVCKGKGTNQPIGSYMKCGECRGSGRKSGTTLTCFTCRGAGVVPDTREVIKTAREEIRQIQKEMAEEVNELYGKVNKKPPTGRGKRLKHLEGGRMDSFQVEELQEQDSGGRYFCQSCAKEIPVASTYKVCEQCFFLYKFGEVRKVEPKEEKENEG